VGFEPTTSAAAAPYLAVLYYLSKGTAMGRELYCSNSIRSTFLPDFSPLRCISARSPFDWSGPQ
jgi:hypothetical protein